MISDFETRLAETLGTRIADPFKGRVDVAPGPAPGGDVRLIVGVVGAQVVDDSLGNRPEVLPGDPVPRRAVRMRCTVSLETRVATPNRGQQMSALEAALYALDDIDFRSGKALLDPDGADLGFLIRELQPSAIVAPLHPDLPDEPRIGISIVASGLFWPVGVKEKAGGVIGEIRLRGGVVPLEIAPSNPQLVAGGSAVELTIRFGASGLLMKEAKTEKMPFGAIAVTLVGPGGKPGKGTLSGGIDGAPATIRIVTVTGNTATVTYTPPATPASEELVVAFDDDEKGMGIEIGRARLATRSS